MIADSVMGWCNRCGTQKRKGTLLVLSGDSGTGKTMMAKNIYHWAVGNNEAMYKHWLKYPSYKWIDWVNWWRKYQSGHGFYDFDDMCEEDILFLDDIGAESDRYKSGESTALLCQLLGKRERLFTVVTTNIPRQHWAEKFDKRVADRLKRNGAEYLDFWGLKSYNE